MNRRTCDISLGPIAVYRTSRSWWRRRWQGEWSDIYCPRAETGFTRRHAELRTLRAWRAAHESGQILERHRRRPATWPYS